MAEIFDAEFLESKIVGTCRARQKAARAPRWLYEWPQKTLHRFAVATRSTFAGSSVNQVAIKKSADCRRTFDTPQRFAIDMHFTHVVMRIYADFRIKRRF